MLEDTGLQACFSHVETDYEVDEIPGPSSSGEAGPKAKSVCIQAEARGRLQTPHPSDMRDDCHSACDTGSSPSRASLVLHADP